jgi:hypothetical protein
MDRSVGAAAGLPESDRQELAIQALARSQPVSDLAARHGVSRKFVYAQTHKARIALDDAFSSATAEDGVLLRDLLGIPVSLGTVHDVLQSSARQAAVINEGADLSGIRVGLHDEIFQGPMPVLAGVCAPISPRTAPAAAGRRHRGYRYQRTASRLGSPRREVASVRDAHTGL